MKSLNWLTALWEIIQTLAMLSKDVERVNTDMKELRNDVHALSQMVRELNNVVAYEKETTKILLDSHKNQINHTEESVAAKFDVLTTRLDAKIADFEHRLTIIFSNPKRDVLLKSDRAKGDFNAASE